METSTSTLDALNEMPLFPTEQTIWHENTPRKCQASREAAAARGAHAQWALMAGLVRGTCGVRWVGLEK